MDKRRSLSPTPENLPSRSPRRIQNFKFFKLKLKPMLRTWRTSTNCTLALVTY
jgi:hypothetical protein